MGTACANGGLRSEPDSQLGLAASICQGARSRAPHSFLNSLVFIIPVTCRPLWTLYLWAFHQSDPA